MDSTAPVKAAGVAIRPLRELDLDEADRIFRLAFGTFLGLPDPAAFMQGAELVRARFRSSPAAFLAAECDGTLAGSCHASDWGSVGFFGPLTIRPDFWDRGVGQELLAAVLALFQDWGTHHIGLFTFPHSPKHIGLYQKFGFWPRSLTAIMRRGVEGPDTGASCVRLSELPADRRTGCIDACFDLTDEVHAGLDLRGEIRAVLAHGTGEILLLWDGSRLKGFAICHCGPGSEAERGTCTVKFGLCRPGPQAEGVFGRLLEGCRDFAALRSARWLVAGVNTARHDAYRAMLAGGFKPDLFGIAMHRPNDPGYDREDVFLMDDWR